jgi:hypothetical protein
MTDSTIFGDGVPDGAAPALTDYVPIGQSPSGETPSFVRQTLASIRNLFMGTPSAAGDFPVSIDDTGKYVKRTLAQAKTILGIGELALLLPGGGLIVPATGGCDQPETITTMINSINYRVNKFAKSAIGEAEIGFAPSAYDNGVVTPYMKIMDVGLNVLNSCEVAWDAAANVTCTLDTTSKLMGANSAKMACASGLAAGALIATDVITSVDLTYALHIDLAVFSTVALDAGDVQLLIDNSATCASPTKTWDLPAIAANTKTKVSITCGDMSGAGNNAIISIGLKQVVDKGAFDLFIDNVSYRTLVTMQFAGNAFGAGDDKDIAYPAVIEATGEPGYFTDTLLTFAPMTFGNTPASGDSLKVQVSRKNVATEAAGKVCFCSAKLTMTRAV